MTRPRWTAHLAGITVFVTAVLAITTAAWTVVDRAATPAEAAPAPTVTATPSVETVEVLPDACLQALVTAADLAGTAAEIAGHAVDAVDLNDQLLVAVAVADRTGPHPDQHALADQVRVALTVAVDDLASVDLADAIGRCDDTTGRTDR